MKVLEINQGKDTLFQVPNAPNYLTNEAKKHYQNMGAILAKNDRLKEAFLNALEVYAEAMAQFEFALKEIKRKNKEKYGTGYIQEFRTGAKNISVELTVKNNAEDTLLKCFKIFGLDPKSEKELKGVTDSNQIDLFEQFLKTNHG
jgi:P27 family predicted phage terminase small subunit